VEVTQQQQASRPQAVFSEPGVDKDPVYGNIGKLGTHTQKGDPMRIALAFAALLAFTSVSFADTVHLKNGRTIDTKSTATEQIGGDPRTVNIPKGKLRLLYSNSGWQDVCIEDVVRIEKNEKDAFERR
jgi:hypothetical protein